MEKQKDWSANAECVIDPAAVQKQKELSDVPDPAWYPDTKNWTKAQQDAYLQDNWALICSVVHRFAKTKEDIQDQAIDTEDLYQVAATACWSAMRTYDPRRRTLFSTYAYKCMQNAIFGVLRPKVVQNVVPYDTELLEDGREITGADNTRISVQRLSPEEYVSLRELHRVIDDTIKTCSNPRVQNIMKDIIQGFRQQDIAMRNDCSQPTVSYYKRRLKKRLTEEGYLQS